MRFSALFTFAFAAVAYTTAFAIPLAGETSGDASSLEARSPHEPASQSLLEARADSDEIAEAATSFMKRAPQNGNPYHYGGAQSQPTRPSNAQHVGSYGVAPVGQLGPPQAQPPRVQQSGYSYGAAPPNHYGPPQAQPGASQHSYGAAPPNTFHPPQQPSRQQFRLNPDMQPPPISFQPQPSSRQEFRLRPEMQPPPISFHPPTPQQQYGQHQQPPPPYPGNYGGPMHQEPPVIPPRPDTPLTPPGQRRPSNQPLTLPPDQNLPPSLSRKPGSRSNWRSG
ncbi:hypothetical protein K474DRAFT_81994 [Panus rudis PR-1116 ss-1]|nr:hypothetical protein K474DRAFT_81994 [Panus rudis PR-1116 ss-1]